MQERGGGGGADVTLHPCVSPDELKGAPDYVSHVPVDMTPSALCLLRRAPKKLPAPSHEVHPFVRHCTYGTWKEVARPASVPPSTQP